MVHIVSGGVDGSVLVQNASGNLTHNYTYHGGDVHAVAWDDFIVSGGLDGVIKWENGEPFQLFSNNVLNIAIHDSTVIVAVGNTIYINDT